MANPMTKPGTAPAKNSFLIEASAKMPYMTIGTLGGIIGPIVDEAAVTAAL